MTGEKCSDNLHRFQLQFDSAIRTRNVRVDSTSISIFGWFKSRMIPNQNAGNPLSQTERDLLVSDLSSGRRSRADVLRAVAENPKLAQAEFNRAFVLMQYFGYLRRNPNDAPDGNFAGYDFWLNKLNSFDGDFVKAEMVKAFLTSAEYRHRFGP